MKIPTRLSNNNSATRLQFSAAPTNATAKQTEENTSSIKAPLKWAGGKRWLLPHLAPLWKHHQQRRYVEPFCGGLSAPLGLQPASALLNDINPHLINFYQQIQQGLEITIPMRNDSALFYEHRTRFNLLIANDQWRTQEAAQLFYFLNRTCFNGLCRFNRNGEFNVPFGRYTQINYAANFDRLRVAVERWSFTNDDIASLTLEKSDFVYADPPYDVEFTTYSAGGFGWEDQVRTAEWLTSHQGPVALSNQATARVVKLYRKLGFQIRYLKGPRRISCTGDRTAARELLATRNI